MPLCITVSECDKNTHLNVNLPTGEKKSAAKNSTVGTELFYLTHHVFAKVKISSFNPAFIVPEEHLESVKEHFHRC